MFGLETTASLAALLAFAGVNAITGNVFGVMLARVSSQPPRVLAFLGILLTVLSNGPILVIVLMLTGNVWVPLVVLVTDIVFIGVYTVTYKYLKEREGVTWR